MAKGLFPRPCSVGIRLSLWHRADVINGLQSCSIAQLAITNLTASPNSKATHHSCISIFETSLSLNGEPCLSKTNNLQLRLTTPLPHRPPEPLR
ncbi:MAG: hypothetical protein ACRCY3_07465, partial [Sphingorhabdus sp.]